MAAPILNAISRGYSARQVLTNIATRYPQYANAINTATNVGYTADVILRHLDRNKEADEDAYLTEHEQVQKRDKEQKKAAALGLLSAAGVAGAVGAGTYGYATRNRAVRPSAILPPIQQPPTAPPGPTTVNITPRGPRPLGGPAGQRGLPAPRKGLPGPKQQGPTPNQPPSLLGQTPKPPVVKTPMENVELIRNIREDTRIANIIQGMGTGAVAVSVLRKVIPKVKLDLLDKVEGGLEKIVQDYGQFLQAESQNTPPATRQESPLVQQQQQEMTPQTQQLAQQASQLIPQQAPEEIQPQVEPEAQEQIQPAPISINERTKQTAFADKPGLKRLVDSSFAGREFSIPNYHYAGESKEDFANRNIINQAVKKAADALKEGKSFLDFPVNPDAMGAKYGYSVAEDVLRFMAGIPNVYDPLLDEEEKQQLYDGLVEQGAPEELRPGEGEQNIYGAQMTPNLVWNLLLSVEPRLSKIDRPPAIKGAPVKGEKMDTTGFRRYLTHGVYGVLSGKSVPPDLADKIGKISQASSSLDIIAKAAEDGNFNKVLKEMEKLASDDEYFFSLFTDEVDEMAAQLGAKGMKVKGTAADTKSANEIKKKLGK
jgi:hypothetical protein